jgi:hypothetical protein
MACNRDIFIQSRNFLRNREEFVICCAPQKENSCVLHVEIGISIFILPRMSKDTVAKSSDVGVYVYI